MESVAKNLAMLLKNIKKKIKYGSQCEGATTWAVWAPLRKKGIYCGSIHPLQTFVSSKTPLKEIYMAVGGCEEAIKKAKVIVEDLGGISFYVPENARANYHAAACICSNYTVTLLEIAQQLISPFMETKKDGLKALMPLLKGTVANLEVAGLAKQALTGPIVRGDVATIETHLKYLPEEFRKTYMTLGMETLNLVDNIELEDKNKLEKMMQNN